LTTKDRVVVSGNFGLSDTAIVKYKNNNFMKKSFFVTYKSPLLVLILILAGGIYSYTKIQSALFPQITFPKIKIIADAGQQPVNQMTVGVTKVLEDAVKSS
jgi:multidrug efflux pump subunit AcrB